MLKSDLPPISSLIYVVIAIGMALAAVWILKSDSRRISSWIFLAGSCLTVVASIFSGIGFAYLEQPNVSDEISFWFGSATVFGLVGATLSLVGIFGIARNYAQLVTSEKLS